MIRLLKRDQIALTIKLSGAILITPLNGGCTSVGPSTSAVISAPSRSTVEGINIVDLNQGTLQLLRQRKTDSFAETFGNQDQRGTIIGKGDALDVTIWEAPPAALFGLSFSPSGNESGRSTSLPEFVVDVSGKISVPFVGEVMVAGRTPDDVGREIAERLRGKAHLPQVMVRLARNVTSTVTVVGEVVNSMRMPLSPKGEHLLDALAAAGGTRQPVDKMTVQISRNGVVRSMPLQVVIRDPRQNIGLLSNDVVTAIYQPYSFTVLGATARNDEVKFEATGLTLAEAMGRIGGLQDGRADPKGVFIFRWEETPTGSDTSRKTEGEERLVPTIYRANLKDPATYFAMQNFWVQNGDVIYVSNSPIADLQRFVGIVASTIFPIAAVETSLNN
jgi:polysaccharide export outer membrane protein